MQPAEERPKPRPRPTPGTGWQPRPAPDLPPPQVPPTGAPTGGTATEERPEVTEQPTVTEQLATEPPAATARPDLEKPANPSGTPTATVGRDRTAPSMPARVTPGVLVAAVGALLTFLAAFLTWASVDVTSRIGGPLVGGGTRSVSGLEGDRLGKATLVLAIAAVALCVLLLQPSSRSWAWIALAGTGGLIVVLALLDLASISDASDLRQRLAQVPGCSQLVQCTGDRTAGVGVYLTIVGGLIVLIGALVHHGLLDRLMRTSPVTRLRRRPAPAAASAAVTPVAADAPAAAEGTATQPVEESVATQPAAHEPAADEPAAQEMPAAEEPSAEESLAEDPPAADPPATTAEHSPAAEDGAGSGSSAT